MKVSLAALGLSFVSFGCTVDNIRAGGNDAGAPTPCTVGADETCNEDPSMSALAGRCIAGTCSCGAGFAKLADGKCGLALGGDAGSGCSPPSACGPADGGPTDSGPSDGGPPDGGPTPGTVSLVAGGATGGVDGAGSAADVGSPWALAYDGANTVYYANESLSVRKVDLVTTQVTTLAGSHHATAVAFDSNANALYYIDSIDAVLSRIDMATGTTTAVAGALGALGAKDGVGTASRFEKPGRLTIGGGKVYVTDGCAIRSFDITTSELKTIAGQPTTCGYQEGTLAAARFGSASFGAAQGGPLGLAMGPNQTLFVADRDNFVIRAVHLDTGMTELVAGSAYGHSDGVYKNAGFQEVKDVVVDAARNRLYVAGTGGMIRRIDLAANYVNNTVTTVAGAWPGETTFSPGTPGKLIRPEALVLVGSDLVGGDLNVIFRVTGL